MFTSITENVSHPIFVPKSSGTVVGDEQDSNGNYAPNMVSLMILLQFMGVNPQIGMDSYNYAVYLNCL